MMAKMILRAILHAVGRVTSEAMLFKKLKNWRRRYR